MDAYPPAEGSLLHWLPSSDSELGLQHLTFQLLNKRLWQTMSYYLPLWPLKETGCVPIRGLHPLKNVLEGQWRHDTEQKAVLIWRNWNWKTATVFDSWQRLQSAPYCFSELSSRPRTCWPLPPAKRDALEADTWGWLGSVQQLFWAKLKGRDKRKHCRQW